MSVYLYICVYLDMSAYLDMRVYREPLPSTANHCCSGYR